MSRFRKYRSIALVLLTLLVAAQAGVSLLVRTHRLRGYLVAHLESAFGRPVEVGEFSLQILPIPELDVDAVSIGEDPAFGHEYFLRAEHMTASFRWLGLLRGHFEFGTMSLTRPSLILVRNAASRWNLEDWLPPAHSISSRASPSSPASAPPALTYHLQKLDFDDGRINFKTNDEKRPFALINVSGSVQQVSPGRWQLRLEAQPWRSGVALQSTGTLQVAGDIAGTSARLQPAQIRLHWGKVSLADLFRLLTGKDPGVRGEFALDGNASVGLTSAGHNAASSFWQFALQARAGQIHRWDLTERSDNPRINVNVKGRWDIASGEARAEELLVELPHSNLNGSAVLQTAGAPKWRVQFKKMAMQGEDLLAWYRGFQPRVAEGIGLNESVTGTLSVSGWPLRWEDGAIEGTAGTLRGPSLTAARIDPFHGHVRDGKFHLDGIRMRLVTETLSRPASEKTEKGPAKLHAIPSTENTIDVALVQDSLAHKGGLRVNLHLTDTAPLFKLAADFGHTLNKGWEYTGGTSGFLAWDWGSSLKDMQRNGSLELTKAQLQVVGLNEPLKLEEARLEWKNRLRDATIEKGAAFGAAWSGTISEEEGAAAGEESSWRFQLHADHLDATELDRWFGPRARPNWLQRLLPSLLGEPNTARASELLRRVTAEGDLTADTLTIEKIKLAKAHAKLGLHALHLDVQDAEAEWAGGSVHGTAQASFSPLPKYELAAEFERVNLAQLPWPARWAERWSGAASGQLHLTTSGVGRQELMRQMAGDGKVKLSSIELRGWDVQSSAESGTLHVGATRWASGEGEFEVGGQELRFKGIELVTSRARTQLTGTIGFNMAGNLTLTPGAMPKRGAKTVTAARALRVSGPLETPMVLVQPVGVAKENP